MASMSVYVTILVLTAILTLDLFPRPASATLLRYTFPPLLLCALGRRAKVTTNLRTQIPLRMASTEADVAQERQQRRQEKKDRKQQPGQSGGGGGRGRGAGGERGGGRGRGGGSAKLRGLPKDSHDVRISKTLSWVLRHGSQSEGLTMRKDGYVRVNDLVRAICCVHADAAEH